MKFLKRSLLTCGIVNVFLAFLLQSCHVSSKVSPTVMMEFAKFHLLENDFLIAGHPAQETSHKMIFAIKQNTRLIDDMLLDVSDPRSLNYGQHLTREQVGQ
jgi:Pro-kumamolisin, activation domain